MDVAPPMIIYLCLAFVFIVVIQIAEPINHIRITKELVIFHWLSYVNKPANSGMRIHIYVHVCEQNMSNSGRMACFNNTLAVILII